MPEKVVLDKFQKFADRVVRGIQGGLSIKVMDMPLGSLPGATEIDKGDTNRLINIVSHEIFHRGGKVCSARNGKLK